VRRLQAQRHRPRERARGDRRLSADQDGLDRQRRQDRQSLRVALMGNFDKLHHICIVVADIDAAQAWYESIGIGPWQAYPPLTEYTDLSVPDPDPFLNPKYRVCNLPSLQLQLCEPGDAPSPQRDFLDTKGGGVF